MLLPTAPGYFKISDWVSVPPHLDISPGHFTWILHLDIAPEYFTWIFHLDVSPGYFTCILHLDISPGYFKISVLLYLLTSPASTLNQPKSLVAFLRILSYVSILFSLQIGLFKSSKCGNSSVKRRVYSLSWSSTETSVHCWVNCGDIIITPSEKICVLPCQIRSEWILQNNRG